jgi:hypothetical protein
MGRFPHRAYTYTNLSRQFVDGYGKTMEITPIYRFLVLLIQLDILETYHRRKTSQQANRLRQSVYAHFERNSQKLIVTNLQAIQY